MNPGSLGFFPRKTWLCRARLVIASQECDGADRHARRYVTRGLGSNPGSPRDAPSSGRGFGCDDWGDSGTAPRLGPMRSPCDESTTPKTGCLFGVSRFAFCAGAFLPTADDRGRCFGSRLCCVTRFAGSNQRYFGPIWVCIWPIRPLMSDCQRISNHGGAELSGAEGAEVRTKNPRSNPAALQVRVE